MRTLRDIFSKRRRPEPHRGTGYYHRDTMKELTTEEVKEMHEKYEREAREKMINKAVDDAWEKTNDRRDR